MRARFALLIRGTASGIIAGAISGWLAALVWFPAEVARKLQMGERLGISEQVTPEQAFANAIFNAMCFGPIGGILIGGLAGALAGMFIPARPLHPARWGIWVGVGTMLGVSLLGFFIWSPMLGLAIVNSVIGGFGGWLGGKWFARGRHD